MWFVFALVTTIAWGVADLFYKAGASEDDRFSHIKTTVAVGVVMGAHALITIATSGIEYDLGALVTYLPVSMCYIVSMAVGYFGLRYLMLSVSSPIQNSSGAVVCIMCLVFLGQSMDMPSAVGVVIICAAVFMLGVLEKREWDRDNSGQKKPKIGFIAFLMPIGYCIIDSLGTFFDAWYLDDFETSPLRPFCTEETLEDVANISYELTFLAVGIILFVYIALRGGIKQKYKPAVFAAALFETAGQATYVYAMSGNGVVAAPMIASYSIVSLILSRIFLKEKLTLWQYVAVTAVMIGIALLGIAEGLAE